MATKAQKTVGGIIAGALAIVGSVIGINYLTSPSIVKIYATKQGDNGLMVRRAYGKDTVIVISEKQNPWSYIFIDANGDSINHLKIVSEGSVTLTAGFAIVSKYVDILGDTADGRFGFNVKGSTGSAISISGEARDIHAQGISADGAGTFAWIKNEPDCNKSTFVMKNIEVDHFEAKNIRLEGFYIGSTNVRKDASTNARPIYCNGVLTAIDPQRIGKLKIHHGLIDGTGRGGVQASFVSEDTAEIHDLTILNTGREFDQAQGNSINLGTKTKAKVWNCNIKYSYTSGICSFGSYLEAWNNTIDSSGYLDGRVVGWGLNIWLDTRPTYDYEKPRFNIHNNTLGVHANPKAIGIYDQVGQGYLTGNVLADNKNGVFEIAPGITYSTTVIMPTPVPNPTPTKTIYHKGYITINSKRVYYVMYTDKTYVLTNSKYQPL